MKRISIMMAIILIIIGYSTWSKAGASVLNTYTLTINNYNEIKLVTVVDEFDKLEVMYNIEDMNISAICRDTINDKNYMENHQGLSKKEYMEQNVNNYARIKMEDDSICLEFRDFSDCHWIIEYENGAKKIIDTDRRSSDLIDIKFDAKKNSVTGDSLEESLYKTRSENDDLNEKIKLKNIIIVVISIIVIIEIIIIVKNRKRRSKNV